LLTHNLASHAVKVKAIEADSTSQPWRKP